MISKMAMKPSHGKGGGQRAPFWRRKPLSALTRREWEAVCDRCGLCCLVKLEDPDTGMVVYTDVACPHLDIGAALCTVYGQRRMHAPECLQLTPQNLPRIPWLPPTCSYRLLRDGRPLPPWHPLVSGEPGSIHRTPFSVCRLAVPHDAVPPEHLVAHVIELPLQSARRLRAGSPC